VLVKIVTLFLIGMAVLAMFGRLRVPRPRLRRRTTCSDCGAPLVGRSPCPCRKVPRG
jgi:hypothetical protein